MSESEFSLSGWPHSADEVREAVADVLPEVSVRDATAVAEGLNAVYFVTVERDGEPRELVLKVATHHSAEGCRAEPHLLDAVRARTEIPVPAVVGTGHLDGDPYFLAERVPGANPGGPEDLPSGALDRICVGAGRHLGELHDGFSADGWGVLGLARGADDLHFDREFPDWPTHFEAWVVHNVERLEGTRFSDLVSAMDDRARALADDLRDRGPFDPVVTHADYRFANLIVDPETGDVNAVLDWATPVAATGEFDLALAGALLADRPGFDDERRRRLRERLYAGYRETNDLDGEGFETRRRCYEFGARLRLMVNFDEEMARRSDADEAARAREHREVLQKWGVE